MLIKNSGLLGKKDLLVADFALEREALRIDAKGNLAQTPHPKIFGDRTKHPYITTDFAEAQVEMVTTVCQTLEEVHQQLTLINQTVLREINDEYLWPYSMPPMVNSNAVEIAKYPDTEAGRKARTYREFLINKYGSGPQLICGIHYNFSFTHQMLTKLHESSGKKESFQHFKDDIYLKITRNYFNYHWFLLYHLGSSPIGVDIKEETAISLRNSNYGYQNMVDLNLSYESVDNHINSIYRAVESGHIVDERENYSTVRLKHANRTDMLGSLKQKGIMYLEFRAIDLNPFELCGISLRQLKFIHLFVLALLEMEEDITWDPKELSDLVALNGLEHQEKLNELSLPVFKVMEKINETFNLGLDDALSIQGPFAQTLLNADFLQIAHAQKEEALKHPYQSYGFEDMEMSTQLLIAQCIKRGVKYDVLDRNANFLSLSNKSKTELVKQASKTSLDSYVSFLAMENKEVTKKILKNKGFPVPGGATYCDIEKALSEFDEYAFSHVVVKPKSTNFGLGIVMFRPLIDKNSFKNALEIAFGFDSEVLVEEFIAGQEYRFLVIDDDVIGVLKRVGANVIGDGISTIKTLVDNKNKHPWRKMGHRSPLEKIQLGEVETHNLAAVGVTPQTVLPAGEQVYLRDNSNISTGGDSIDVTEIVHPYFKEQAIQAAHAIGSRVCGVDIIINGDLSNETAPFAFIELNFNPALHMHAFVLEGTGRDATPHILKALELIEDV